MVLLSGSKGVSRSLAHHRRPYETCVLSGREQQRLDSSQ